MAWVDEAQAFLDTALVDDRGDGRRDVFERHPGGELEAEVLGVGPHNRTHGLLNTLSTAYRGDPGSTTGGANVVAGASPPRAFE